MKSGDFIFDPYEIITNQLMMAKTHADVARGPVTGTLTFTAVATWILAGRRN
jgi:hypothetical protein